MVWLCFALGGKKYPPQTQRDDKIKGSLGVYSSVLQHQSFSILGKCGKVFWSASAVDFLNWFVVFPSLALQIHSLKFSLKKNHYISCNSVLGHSVNCGCLPDTSNYAVEFELVIEWIFNALLLLFYLYFPYLGLLCNSRFISFHSFLQWHILLSVHHVPDTIPFFWGKWNHTVIKAWIFKKHANLSSSLAP